MMNEGGDGVIMLRRRDNEGEKEDEKKVAHGGKGGEGREVIEEIMEIGNEEEEE